MKCDSCRWNLDEIRSELEFEMMNPRLSGEFGETGIVFDENAYAPVAEISNSPVSLVG